METTVQDAGGQKTCDLSPSDQFTAANVVGLFLVVTLCLVTQPWGSLFFRPPRKDDYGIVKLCFFLWRLNPVACAAETLVIVASLVVTARHILRQHHSTTFDGVSLVVVANEFRNTAAALVSLRTGDDDAQAPGHRRRSDSGASLTSESGPRANAAQVDIGSSGGMDSASSGLGVTLRRRTNPSSDHETSPADSPETSPDDDSERRARTASRSPPSVSGREWVDKMALFSVLLTLVKVLVIIVPWYIRFAVLAMLTDWLAVQALLVLSGPLIGLSGVAVKRSTLSLHKSVAESLSLSVVFHLLAVPTMAYLSYEIGFALFYQDPKTESGYNLIVFRQMERLNTELSQALYIMTFFFPLLWPFSLALLLGMAPLVGPPALLMIALTECVYDISNYYLPGPIVLLGMVGAMVAEMLFFLSFGIEEHMGTWMGLVCTVTLIAFLYFTCVFPSWKFHKESSGITASLVCVSTILWFYIFYFVVEEYDETGTYKPSWLEYLG